MSALVRRRFRRLSTRAVAIWIPAFMLSCMFMGAALFDLLTRRKSIPEWAFTLACGAALASAWRLGLALRISRGRRIGVFSKGASQE